MKELIKHIIYSVMLAFMVVFIFSCGKESSCFKGSGTTITEQRAIDNTITEIVIEDNIDVIISQGAESKLAIEGGENLLPYINTDISGSLLKITSDNKCGFFRDYNKPLTAYIILPDLKKITINGQSDMASDGILDVSTLDVDMRKATGTVQLNLNADAVAIRQHTGPADVYLSGTTKKLYAYSGGNGWLYLNGMQVKNAHVNHGGTGDIFVKADSTLLVELTSIGNINYYGNPLVTVSVNSGKGDLRKKD